MLRNLQIKPNKPVDTTYKSSETLMITDMGVVKDYADKTVGFPAAETADNVYMVDKERIPTGINAGRTDMSDYDPEFNEIKKDELIKLHEPESNERRATDQCVTAGLAVGDRLVVGTDGKWKKATNTVNSKYIYAGNHTSDGKTLAIIEITQEPGKNA